MGSGCSPSSQRTQRWQKPRVAHVKAVMGGANPSTALMALPSGRCVSDSKTMLKTVGVLPHFTNRLLLLSLAAARTHTTRHALFTGVSPFLPKAPTAAPAKEPGAHVQISCSLFCFIPAAGGAAFCVIYSVLLTRCSEDGIIYVLLSFSRLLGAVASTRCANSCSRSACVSELRGGTKGPFYRHKAEKV